MASRRRSSRTEDFSDREESESILSDQANLVLGENEEGVDRAIQDARPSELWGPASAEKYAAYQEYRDKYGGEGSGVARMDRSKPVGSTGAELADTENFRSSTDWRDQRDMRMFRLDQGMADRDDARSPTMDSTDALFRSTEYLNHAVAQTQALDPQLAFELQVADRFLLLYPELAVTTRNGFGFAGVTEQTVALLLGQDVEEFADLALTEFLLESDIKDRFYTEFGDMMDPATKDLLIVSMAGLSEKEQKHQFAKAAAYLDARPMITAQDQMEFATFMAQEASATYARESDQSFWGKFGRVGAHVFTNPADWIQDEFIGGLFTASTDPASAWYREELQLEETMAIAFGHEPGTSGYATFVGLAGAGIDIFIDPTNIALGGLGALKAIKTAAMFDDVFRGTARFRTVARQFVPFGSRKAAIAVGLPTGVRGRSARIAWAMFAKNHDGLMAVARKNGVFSTIAASSDYAMIIDKIPSLRKADAGLVEMLLRQDGAEAVEKLYDAALRGSLLDPNSMAHAKIISGEIEASDDVKRLLVELDNASLSAGDIVAVNGGGLYHNMPIELADDIVDTTPLKARKQTMRVTEEGLEVVAEGNEGVAEDVISMADVVLNNKNAVTPEGVVNAVLKNGDSIAITYGKAADGTIFTIAKDADGGIIGARIGTSSGTVASSRKKGVYEEVLKVQRDKQGVTLQSFKDGTDTVEEGAARVINTVFGPADGIGRKAGKAGTARVADPLSDLGEGVHFIKKGDTQVLKVRNGTKQFDKVVSWIKKNTKYKNSGMNKDGTIRRDALLAYMRAENVDVVALNGTYVFRDIDKLQAEGKLVRFVSGGQQNAALEASNLNLTRAAHYRRMVTPKADQVSKWVISDMPTTVGTKFDDILFWRKKFGVYEGKKYTELNFRQRKLRGFVAKVFLPDVPSSIATGFVNRNDGVRELTQLLTQMGVDPALLKRSINAYMDDPSQARVLSIITDAADDIGDPEIMLGLMHFNEKLTSELEYAVINGSEQLTNGIRVDGGVSLQPLMPSQLRQFVQLPDPQAFSAHIRRYKRATNRTFKSRNRGWGRDRVARDALVQSLGKELPEGSEQAARWAAMTQDERMITAYATVRPAGSKLGDGLGYAAKFGQTAGEQWGRLRNAFSVTMLAWRPIAWMGNEMMDNAWRASMADGLSFFTHPFRSMEAIHDSKLIARALEERKAYIQATAGVRSMLAIQAPSGSVLLDRVSGVIPSIRQHVKHFDDAAEQANEIRRFLNNDLITSTETIKILDSPLATAVHKQRKGFRAAQKYDLPVGKNGELFDPDWADIELTGMEQNFTRTIASASARHEYQIGVRTPPAALEGYTTALGNVWGRDLRDPAIRMYLDQLNVIRNGGTDASHAARNFVNSGGWHTMEEPIRNMARHSGVDMSNMNDLELAEWYFKNKIGPYVDDVFGDVLSPENLAAGFRNGTFEVEINGVRHIVDVDNEQTIIDLVQAANGTDFVLPKSVVGVVNPRMVYGKADAAKGWKTPLRSYNAWAFKKFGTEVPVAYQRRPAYLTAFKRFKDNYVRLGMTAEGADYAARLKAIEHINTTFFFVEAQTPFLKSMNNVVPFFAAQYEIVKAWTWNIPATQGAFGVGHARMLRSFDHVFTTMRENGLLQPHYDREGKVDSWNLMFADNPHTQNIAGMVLSKGGFIAMMSPAILVEQIASIAFGADLDIKPDEITFKFNHPYEFLGRGGGVLPTARMQMGLNPVMALPASTITKALPFTTHSAGVEVTEEENLELFLANEGITDRTAFLTLNRHVLLESGAITEDELERLNAGTLGFSTIKLPAGVEVMVPESTLAGEWIKNLLFPYGTTDSFQEVISDFTPQVLSRMAKSMGLFMNDGEEGATSWLPDLLMGPTGRSGMGMARADALITLEMRTGMISRSGELAEELIDLDPDDPRARVIQDEMRALDNAITSEVKGIATSRAFMQMLFGIFVPFSPKMPTETATLREYYFQSRMVADQWKEGKPMPMPFDNQNAIEAWQMVSAWASDDTGTAAKIEFLGQHGGRSSILAAITPRTYWGGTGLPVWDMEQYFQQVEDGDILPLPVDVLRFKIRSSQILVEREMLIIEKYSNDPMRQATAMMADAAGWKEITEESDNRWKALEMEDEIINDGAWAEHSLNVADNFVDFAANEQQEIIEAMDAVQLVVDMDVFPDDPREANEIRKMLAGMRDSAYAAVDVYNDGRYADWDVSPRQKIVNEYWEAWGDYNDELQEQYALVEGANTAEELSAVYNDIARWKKVNDVGIIIDGVRFASPAERSWGALDREHKLAVADDKLDGKLEWLTYTDIAHIIEVYPKAEPFMPTSEIAKNIFMWKSDQEAMLARKYRIGGGAIEENYGSTRDRKWTQDWINEEFDRKLLAAGEFGVIEHLDSYPIESLMKYDALPEQLEWLVPYSVAVKRQLDGGEHSPLSNAGHVQQRWVYQKVLDWFEGRDDRRDEFILWGIRAFGESTVDAIVANMLGNYQGDMT